MCLRASRNVLGIRRNDGLDIVADCFVPESSAFAGDIAMRRGEAVRSAVKQRFIAAAEAVADSIAGGVQPGNRIEILIEDLQLVIAADAAHCAVEVVVHLPGLIWAVIDRIEVTFGFHEVQVLALVA